MSESVAESHHDLMALVADADGTGNVILGGVVGIGIVHEGPEVTLGDAVLVGCREVQLSEGVAEAAGDAVGLFPVGEVGG